MKKLNIILTVMAVTVAFISCSKQSSDEELAVFNKSSVITSASTPTSYNGIVPVIISGANKGGNRSCAEVAQAFGTTFDLCGEKLDYGEYGFSGSFPEGLDVTVTGNYISFNIDGCLEINGSYYKVGAVIVKGSNSANIYYYPDGSTGDSGLAAPGGNRMVSNLTFCFVSCEMPEDVIIAVKAWFFKSYDFENNIGTDRDYTLSTGTYIYDYPWCDLLGINELKASEFPLLGNVGTVKIEEGWPGGVHSWIVTVDLKDGMAFDHTSIYVGSLSGLTTGSMDAYGCPAYGNWPYQDATKANTQVFTIPY